MLDFVVIKDTVKSGKRLVTPSFISYTENGEPVKDILIKGRDFYGMWDESRGAWTTSLSRAYSIIDRETNTYRKEHKVDPTVNVDYMRDCDSAAIDKFKKFTQKQLDDNYVPLDSKLTFANTKRVRADYCSKKLSYSLPEEDVTPKMYPCWDLLVSTLYDEEDRHKIEWAIGCVVSGDSVKVQKFFVFYGSPGSGKSTILNIIGDMFKGYTTSFSSADLVNTNSAFSLEPFKNNPLVGIEHDGDLSKVNGNCRLNSLVSHEGMQINEKFKSLYENKILAMLFIGTNKAVKITDSKSGLLRRAVDIIPSGRKLNKETYDRVMRDVKTEYGAIAKHCLEVYLGSKKKYNDYIPITFQEETDDFFNFMLDYHDEFAKTEGIYLSRAWDTYKAWLEEARMQNGCNKKVFKVEFRKYFKTYEKEKDGRKDFYRDLDERLFRVFAQDDDKTKNIVKAAKELSWLDFDDVDPEYNVFNKVCADCPAQLAKSDGTPRKSWDNVKTTLSSIVTTQLHYVRVPLSHIVIDFDIPDPKTGEKSLELNLAAAAKWPATYAELSKSGKGIHLHYIYDGDPTTLSTLYDDKVEIKVFEGKQSLRRLLTKCVNLEIAHLSSGLPLKKEKDTMIDDKNIEDEQHLRNLINKALNKDIHDATKPNMDFIVKITNEFYESGKHYDISDMHDDIFDFAMRSSHQSDLCMKMVSNIHWKSDDVGAYKELNGAPLVHFDIEVFQNLLLVCYMFDDDETETVYDLVNPSPSQIERLFSYNLIGFNNRKYDNHIVYGCYLGDTALDSYNRSQSIINNGTGFIGEAYNLSYTDIYDFISDKKSLKKLEIEMGIRHLELGLPWDKPVPEELWSKVIEYCHNDVKATKAVFHYKAADFTARKILADLAGGTVNDTTNSLTTKFIFGNDKNPQSQFYYRDLSKPIYEKDLDPETIAFLKETFPEMMAQPHGEAKSLLPYFPGYKFEMTDKGYKSTYLGEEAGEGGFAEGFPGYYENAGLLDVMSMHPHSAMAECIFGPKYTKAFHEIVYGRVHIKHKAWDIVDNYLDGKLKPYIEKCKAGEMSSKDLANALKIAINSVYGLTAAKFDNPFRDKRNVDNIVAKRGALFMIELKHEFIKRGWPVAHIKTDSIKVPNATMEQIHFVMEFGKRYGYYFEHEATYEKMVLVNDAVYIAKYASKENCEKMYGYIPGDNFDHGGQWTATGKEFQIPFVFKSMFSKEPITFVDKIQTFSVSKGDLYLDFDEGVDRVKRTALEAELKKLETKLKKHIKDGCLNITPTELDKLKADINALEEELCKYHNYSYVGRVSSFVPMQYGTGSGVLYRMADGKANAAAGTTGYRWLETAMVEGTELEDMVDISYWTAMVDTAKDSINQYVPYDEFVVKEVPPIEKGKCCRDCAHCAFLERWDAEEFISCAENFEHIEEYAKEIGYEVLPF